MRNFVKVVNLEDTAEERAPGGKSWIEYWRDNCDDIGQFDEQCCRKGCLNVAEHGAHVRKYGGGLLSRLLQYIVPLCVECNNPENTDVFEVPKEYLVLIV